MILTEDGSYKLRDKKRSKTFSRTAVYVSGTMGTATATLSYYNSSGTAIPLEDGTLEINKQYLIHDGVDKDIHIVVATADGSTAIDVETHGVV